MSPLGQNAKYSQGADDFRFAPTSDIARQPRWTIESTFTLWQALYNPKVLLLALNYVGIVTASLGMLIFVPQMMVPIRRLHGPATTESGRTE
jgi:uncharacterized membrane protein YhaH (DUF805 family)